MPELLQVDGIWELPLVVEGYALERLSADGYERETTQMRLFGAGEEGLGEDVMLLREPDDAPPADLELAGSRTLASFIDHLATVEQWRKPPEWGELAKAWRNWAFESAALDLALRQAGLSLAEALGRSASPLRFVNSLGLGDPPSVDGIAQRLARYPSVGFKIDADAKWTPKIVAELAGLACVQTVDFKGRYGIPVEDEGALIAMYRAVVPAFPEARFEDPHELPEVAELLEPVWDRVSFDAPVRTVSDITTRTINVKPSRIGRLRELFAIYAWCADNGVEMYGGGMGELGVGRGQIELLASLFHPDSPNDVAPSAFNAVELGDGLPASPLVPPAAFAPGFRWEAAAG